MTGARRHHERPGHRRGGRAAQRMSQRQRSTSCFELPARIRARRPRMPPRGDRARSGRRCRHRPAASGTDTGAPASPRTGRPGPATAAPRTSRRGRRPYLCRVQAGHLEPGHHARRSGGLGGAFRRRLRGRRVGRVPCLELECLAAVVASCHGSVTLARPAPEASGQVRAIRQAGSSAASARQHDADALVLGSHLARRRPRLEALGAQAPVEIRKRLQHIYSSRGVQHSLSIGTRVPSLKIVSNGEHPNCAKRRLLSAPENDAPPPA